MIRLLALAILTATLALSGAAAAAPSGGVREGLSGEAATKFDEGSRLYRAGTFAAAREAFLAAYARSGDRRVLYNVAVCDKAVGRYARAILVLRSSLTASEPELPAEYVQRVSDTIATLARYVAVVNVRPVDATSGEAIAEPSLIVDREAMHGASVPLDTGLHEIVVAKEGYEAATATVDVRAGDVRDITVPLTPAKALDPSAPPTSEPSAAPARARLRLSTDNPRDRITLDGVVVATRGVDLDVPAGEHHLSIARDGAPSKEIDLVLRPDETRDLRVSLPAGRAGISPWWFVGGGLVLATATAVGVYFATRPTTFEGSSAGTLNPFVVPAAFAFE